MSIEYSPDQVEDIRLACIAEHDDSDEPPIPGEEKVDWLKQLEDFGTPGTFSYHEALHTASIMMENVGNHLLEHPAVLMDREAFALAHAAHTTLFNLYQHLGQKHLIDHVASPGDGQP